MIHNLTHIVFSLSSILVLAVLVAITMEITDTNICAEDIGGNVAFLTLS